MRRAEPSHDEHAEKPASEPMTEPEPPAGDPDAIPRDASEPALEDGWVEA